MVRMSAALHPFKAQRADLSLPQGLSIKQMMEIAQPDEILRRNAIVFVKGEIIPQDRWPYYKPKVGTLVEVRSFPVPRGGGEGGGKNALRIVLTIAVIAFAAWAGPALAGTMFSAEVIAAQGAWVTFSTAALTGIVATAGMLIVNAIAPIRPPKLNSLSSTPGQAQDSPTLFIEGARNQLRPFSPVPKILGRYRVTPNFASKPFTEVIGDKQFVRMLFVWGIGPVEFDPDSFKIGETSLSEFTGYQIEHREGYASDDPLTLFPSAVEQEDFSILLSQTASWVTRTSSDDADELSVDLSFPSGLVEFDERGNRVERSVNIEIEYRMVGDSPWLKIDTSDSKFNTTANAAWLNKTGDDLNSITFTQNRTSAIRHGIRWGVAQRGQYEIRIRRTTADTDSTQIFDAATWSTLRTITNEDPVNSPVPVAKTALVIQATDQLNGIVDEFNGIVTAVALDWDSGTETWIERATQNPASLFRHVLQGKGSFSPLSDARVDLETLQEWHEFCDEKGLKFNMVRDFTASIWDTLADIASAGRAAPTQIDGKWSVVIEKERANPVSFITPRNSFDFRAERFFISPPHGWRIPFPNENEGFRFDERRVYRDGYSDENATVFENLELTGVTDPDQIFKLGRFRIAQGMLQQERWSFKQDMEFLTYKRGDRVAITHDVLLVGLAYGRIKEVVLSGADVTGIVLDEEVTMQIGQSYGIAVRTITSAKVTAAVVNSESTTKILTLASSIPGVGSPAVPAVSAGDMFGFGILGQETDDASIISIIPDSDLRAQITAVPYRPAIFTADTEAIPEYTTNLTPLQAIPAPNVRNVVSDESALALGPGDTLRVRIGIDFDPLNRELFGVEPELRVQMRPSGTGEPYFAAEIDSQETNHIFISGVRTGEIWDIRMRFVIPGKLPGPWVTIPNHTVIGKSTPPNPLSGMTISAFGAQALIRWEKPNELDVVFGGEVVFRHCPDFDNPQWSESVTIGQSARARTLYAVLPLKPGSYLARVYDIAGNPSEEITIVTTKQASVHAFASVDTLDDAPDFLGTHDGTVEDGSGNLTIDEAASPAVIEGTYNFAQGIDLGAVMRVRLTTRLTVSIFRVGDNIDDRLDNIDTWEDFDGDLLEGADARVFVRHTDDNPSGSPVTWSAWERLDSAEFEARAFEFYVVLTRDSVDYNILVSELGIDVDEVV